MCVRERDIEREREIAEGNEEVKSSLIPITAFQQTKQTNRTNNAEVIKILDEG